MRTLIGGFGAMLEMAHSLWRLLIKTNLVVVLSLRRMEIMCSRLYLQFGRTTSHSKVMFFS